MIRYKDARLSECPYRCGEMNCFATPGTRPPCNECEKRNECCAERNSCEPWHCSIYLNAKERNENARAAENQKPA